MIYVWLAAMIALITVAVVLDARSVQADERERRAAHRRLMNEMRDW